MTSGADRYDVKAAAGMSRIRPDGSDYSREVDELAETAERWFAGLVGGLVDDSVSLHGDHGYDVAVFRRGITVKVDVVHAGMMKDGTPRTGRGCRLIVNCDHNKLVRSDILVLVEGPPFAVLGAIHTARFLALAQVENLGYGDKFTMPVSALMPLALVLG